MTKSDTPLSPIGLEHLFKTGEAAKSKWVKVVISTELGQRQKSA